VSHKNQLRSQASSSIDTSWVKCWARLNAGLSSTFQDPHSMSLTCEITLAICESVYSNPHSCQHLLLLLVVNHVVCDITIVILWRKLPSVLTLLHLMPEDIIKRHLAVDGIWHYVSCFIIHDMGNPHSALVIAWPSFTFPTRPTSCLRPSCLCHHLTRAHSDL